MNFPFLDGDGPRSTSYGVYISQLFRFARVSSHFDDFNTRNKVLTSKLLRQGHRYHKRRKAFLKFYRYFLRDVLDEILNLIESFLRVFLPTLLFWFFGEFRCGALLFMVILVIYKYKNR